MQVCVLNIQILNGMELVEEVIQDNSKGEGVKKAEGCPLTLHTINPSLVVLEPFPHNTTDTQPLPDSEDALFLGPFVSGLRKA